MVGLQLIRIVNLNFGITFWKTDQIIKLSKTALLSGQLPSYLQIVNEYMRSVDAAHTEHY